MSTFTEGFILVLKEIRRGGGFGAEGRSKHSTVTVVRNASVYRVEDLSVDASSSITSSTRSLCSTGRAAHPLDFRCEPEGAEPFGGAPPIPRQRRYPS
jgi:hypothetical protein